MQVPEGSPRERVKASLGFLLSARQAQLTLLVTYTLDSKATVIIGLSPTKIRGLRDHFFLRRPCHLPHLTSNFSHISFTDLFIFLHSKMGLGKYIVFGLGGETTLVAQDAVSSYFVFSGLSRLSSRSGVCND
jgi:hypothetical protein